MAPGTTERKDQKGSQQCGWFRGQAATLPTCSGEMLQMSAGAAGN